MRRILLAMLVCAACKHSTSSSSTSHSETSTVTDTTSSESGAVTTVTTQTEGPGKTTTTVEEYAPPDYSSQSDSSQIPGQARQSTGTVSTNSDHSSNQAARESPPSGMNGSGTPDSITSRSEKPTGEDSVRHGPLVKRTVTVTEHGAETSETHQQASTQVQGATETRAQAKGDTTARAASETKPAASCVSLGWLWGLILLAVAFAAWRVIRRP